MRAEYPIFLDLQGRKCLIIGGGAVAERKTSSLMETGAELTVVSPCVSKKMEGWATAGLLEWQPRPFRTGDTAGFLLVFCATDSAETNRIAAMEARAGNSLVNVADARELCDFTVPAAIRQSQLTIAVSTNGQSPAFARELRKELSSRYGPEYGEYLDLIACVRAEWKKTEATCEARQRRWLDFADFDPEVLRLLREGRRREAEGRIYNEFGCPGTES